MTVRIVEMICLSDGAMVMSWGINCSSRVVDNREADQWKARSRVAWRLDVFAEVEVPQFSRRAEAVLPPASLLY